MLPWLPWERRWRDALLGAVLPAAAGLPGLADLDTAAFWPRFFGAAPPLLRLGLRVAVWVLTWSPPLLVHRFRLFAGLSHEEKQRCLEAALGHRSYLLRQLVTVLKLVACFAWFEDPGARRQATAP